MNSNMAVSAGSMSTDGSSSSWDESDECESNSHLPLMQQKRSDKQAHTLSPTHATVSINSTPHLTLTSHLSHQPAKSSPSCMQEVKRTFTVSSTHIHQLMQGSTALTIDDASHRHFSRLMDHCPCLTVILPLLCVVWCVCLACGLTVFPLPPPVDPALLIHLPAHGIRLLWHHITLTGSGAETTPSNNHAGTQHGHACAQCSLTLGRQLTHTYCPALVASASASASSLYCARLYVCMFGMCCSVCFVMSSI